MRELIERARNEPVLVTALIGAVLYGLTEFGISMTDGQQAAILGVAGAILALFARSQVYPVRTINVVDEEEDDEDTFFV